MNKYVFLLVSLSLFLFNTVMADDDVLIKINGKTITASEFISVYKKNNLQNLAVEQKDIDEYLDLYINFNLKVLEAIEQGLDTTTVFVSELENYREQLAQPYLNDQLVTEQLIEEAYDRMKYDLRASHILIALPEYALPEDTIAAYEKITEIRKRIINGEDFGKLAKQFSDDPSAKNTPPQGNRPAMKGNEGDLGYFSVFSMVYPFETAAYNTPVGEISDIVRTNFGYHIIKVTDKIPAMGQISAAHIMLAVPGNADEKTKNEAEAKINEIYQKLLDGEDFVSLVKRFSDDKGSAARDGDFPPFTVNRMLPEVIKAISTMNEDMKYTEPVLTRYGWHVFKINKISGIKEFEDNYPELKSKVAKDIRSQISQESVIDRLKEEYGFKEDLEMIEPISEIVDSSIFKGKWKPEDQETEHLNETIFSIDDKKYSQQDFINYLKKNQIARNPENIPSYIRGMYMQFVNNSILDYEDSRLDEKYPEFNKIMKEYHDGILLFELTDKMVWSKAMEDTTGLKKFFEENKDNYKWDERVEAVIYQCDNKRIAKKLRKAVRKANKSGEDSGDILDKFNDKSMLNASAKEGFFEKNDHEVLDAVPYEKGVSKVIKIDKDYFVVDIKDVLEPAYKKINEVRGLVIADYQNYLEEKWISELRDKYDIKINEHVLEKVKKELN
ncbi:MAG: peptidylprolyl isomerase [Bacteroidota bacterium]